MSPTQRKPNIIFIHVDEMRFPMHFPPGIQNADQFLAKFMPNLHYLWQKGVKFTRYYTGAADCTPGRGTFVTGLYAYQTNLFLTRESTSNPYDTKQPQPHLQPEFETYGRLLFEAGYDTPYIGKWHLSDSPETPTSPGADNYLNEYGFKGLTIPDPLGMPAQGLGLTKPQYQGAPPPAGDPEIAAQALNWLFNRAQNNTKPFCLTVGFVNPHDKQFFWGGTQANQLNAVYNTIPDNSSPTGFEMPAMSFNPVVGPPPPPNTYNGPPVNWQSSAELEQTKPKLQTLFKEMFAYYWTGLISEDQSQRYFRAEPSRYAPSKHNAVAPYQYWARALDFYTQMMSAVDVHIGQVIHNIPQSFASNTIIVFSADHGEYASSHGLQGKGGTVYEECFNVPLIVYDPQGQFTVNPATERTQLASSVDLLRMLVTMGYGGDETWLNNEPYKSLWGGNIRANLCAILQNATAPGRPYVVYSTDEFFSTTQDLHHDAPSHVIGLLTAAGTPNPDSGKFGFYHHWKPNTTDLNVDLPSEKEYYNYGTELGKMERQNTAGTPAATNAENFLFSTAIPQQLKRPLPTKYQAAQKKALEEYWNYVKSTDAKAIASTAFA